jgi:hypothetical protein
MSYIPMPSKATVEQQKLAPVVADIYGGRIPDIEGSQSSAVTHNCSGRPLSAKEKVERGIAVSEVYYRLVAEVTWSGGINSRVTFDGRSFEQVGEAEFHKRNPITQHAKVLLRAVTSEGK